MTQYNGYVSIPHSSYDEWRNATLGNGYNVDGAYGNQCWDYCAELWHQYNLTLITKPGGGSACDCWLISRTANAKTPFIAVEGKTNIKRGDVIVTNRNQFSSTGHICIADEDYNGSNEIWTLGQSPSLHTTSGAVSRDKLSLTYFLGVFRNTYWDSPTPPSPPIPPMPGGRTEENGKKKFPWVVAWNNWKGYSH